MNDKHQLLRDHAPPSIFHILPIIKPNKMKLLLRTLLLLFISTSSFAQLNKGNWIVGGTGQLNAYNDVYTTSTFYIESKYLDIDISPSVGYFVSKKVALGLRPTFSWTKAKGLSSSGGVSGGSTDLKRYGIGPFGRYYFLKADNPFNIVSDVSYQYGIYDFKGQNGKINTFSAMAGPVIYFNSSVGLEFTLGYASRTEDVKESYKDTRKGFQVAVGFQIHLEKE